MNKSGRIFGAILLAASFFSPIIPRKTVFTPPAPSFELNDGILFDTELVFSSSADESADLSTPTFSEAADKLADEASEAALVECERNANGDLTIGSRLWELLFNDKEKGEKDSERRELIVGGAVFGTRIKESRVTVSSPDEGGILREGDKIISINGKSISSINSIKDILSSADGSPISVVCKRGGKQVSLTLTPKLVGDNWRLGAVLREGAAGLGTITYIDPRTGEFGGLGHAISDPDTGEIIEMSGGTVTDVIIGGVVKGAGGKPGELSGILTDRNNGEIYTNTDCGVFGRLTKIPSSCREVLPVAHRSEVNAGDATIISTLKNGKTMEYSIEIFDVKENATGTKCFKIKVTDPALLAISGGIVRGMSGSPIIQDGKLVGAVTHVMVADPTEGYGIFIENMLNASSSARNELPRVA